MRLIQIAEHYWWELDGQLAFAGIEELTRLPFRRFLTAIMHFARPKGYSEESEEQTRRFDEWLFSPLGLLDPDNVPEDVIEDEMAAFRAFSTQAGGGS